MDTVQYLNAFISERLTAAAVEIFGAVEKTLVEYQGEISRSKQEVDHLRKLVLWPEVRLHRSAHRFSHLRCDQEASPDCCHEEGWTPDHPSNLHVKEDRAHRGGLRGPACGQRGDTASPPPPSEKGEGHEELPSHLCRVSITEQTADIKAEPDGDELITSPSTEEAESKTGCRRYPLDGVQHYTERDWSLFQDHEDPDRLQIKAENFAPESPREDTHNNCKLPLQPERGVYDEPHSSSARPSPTVANRTLHTAEEKRGDAEGEGRWPSGLTRVSQPFCSVNQSEGVLNGEGIKALTEARKRDKKRQNSAVSELARERRHSCPVCSKDFKRRGYLRDHMKIHTGEKPHQCADCGRRFSRKGVMKSHRLIHKEEKPHLCLVCGKSFKWKRNLHPHLKIHARDKMDYTQPL